ncbi:MAG: class II fumarate hydratase [Candidatus Melainabacteria bacterium]|nr:class II fumarate hydratase [Candidatus Melainabacteria bacterium]
MPEANSTHGTREERDSMGTVLVPADAYYGASTQRAVQNFPISDLRLPSEFNRAVARIKKAACRVNCGLGLIDSDKAEGIDLALEEVLIGRFDRWFVVDVFQTGSGTSTNMNVNEVVARRARELMGGDANARDLVHPNDHVNLGQSSNDVIPTALHLSAYEEILTRLIPALTKLEKSLKKKSKQFRSVVKTGRTHLQDATPVTLGQVFGGYAAQVGEANKHLKQTSKRLSQVALGGTAVGTGLNAHPKFASEVCKLLSADFAFPVREARNHFRAQSTIDDVVAVSGAIRVAAVALMKIADDVRWMGSGPRAGFGEITIPEVQPGSSIMPGKVNPVIAESLRQVVVQVVSNDSAIAFAGQSENFELSVMLPVVAYNFLQSISILANATNNFATRCVDDLTATTRGPELVETGLALVTALVPVIGYDESARLAKIAAKTGETVFVVALRETNIPEAKLKKLLNPLKLTRRG